MVSEAARGFWRGLLLRLQQLSGASRSVYTGGGANSLQRALHGRERRDDADLLLI